MNEYAILIGFPTYADPIEAAKAEQRRSTLYELVFSLGPAWHGNQDSILLKTDLTREEIVNWLLPLVGYSDLVAVMEITTRSIAAIGYNADEEGLQAVHPNVKKIEVPLS